LRRPRCDRHIQRKAVKGLLPDAVRQRTSKADFTLVYAPHTAILTSSKLSAFVSATLWIEPQKFSMVQSNAQKDDLQWSSGMLLQLAFCAEIFNNTTKPSGSTVQDR